MSNVVKYYGKIKQSKISEDIWFLLLLKVFFLKFISALNPVILISLFISLLIGETFVQYVGGTAKLSMWVAPIYAGIEIFLRIPLYAMQLSVVTLPPPEDVRQWVQQSA